MIRVRPWMLCTVLAVTAAVTAAAVGAFAADGGPRAAVQTKVRTLSRVVLFGDKGLAGEYSIQYGSPEWKPAYDQDFEKITRGQRIRLGNDWWTTLDSFETLTFTDQAGGTTELAAGSWFLALDCSAEGAWNLVALDPAPIRKAKLDAFASAKTTGGTLVPMQYDTVEDEESSLKIGFVAVEGKPLEQTLEIRFGKHRLRTAVTPKL